MDREKLNELISTTMQMGFNMGVVSMRLKMMQTLMPYMDAEVIASDLLTTRDVIKMMADTMTEFDMDSEFTSMTETMKGLGDGSFPPKF